MIKGKFRRWNRKNIGNSSKKSGVYGLYDQNKNLIYVGSSRNINVRLLFYHHSNFSEDICKRETAYFKQEVSGRPVQRERELIRRFKKVNKELPYCNDLVP